jgi:hypothetical protein
VSGVELLDYFKQTNDQTMLKYISIIEKQDWPVLYDNSKEGIHCFLLKLNLFSFICSPSDEQQIFSNIS